MLCKLKLSLRCVFSGCTVTSRPPCTFGQRTVWHKQLVILLVNCIMVLWPCQKVFPIQTAIYVMGRRCGGPPLKHSWWWRQVYKRYFDFELMQLLVKQVCHNWLEVVTWLLATHTHTQVGTDYVAFCATHYIDGVNAVLGDVWAWSAGFGRNCLMHFKALLDFLGDSKITKESGWPVLVRVWTG